MKVNNCRKCQQPPVLRSRHDLRHNLYYAWMECETCKARTGEFIDRQEPTESTQGGQWAVLAWNCTQGAGGAENGRKSERSTESL